MQIENWKLKIGQYTLPDFFFLISFFFFLSSFIFSQTNSAQKTTDDIFAETDQRNYGDGASTIYKNEHSGALLVHSFGWGGNFRKGKHITAKLRSIYSIEAVGMKHPKEYKSYNPHNGNNKGYVYGKLNTLTIFRPAAGIQKIMFTKEGKRGVQVSYVLLGGVSLGFVKPVYLEIDQGRSLPPRTEKHDPEKQSQADILGRSPILKGVDEGKIYPGLHSKIGFNFEYAPQENIIRAIETGIAVDAFYKPVPMMAYFENKQFFITYYVSWHFGKKSF